MKAKNIKHVKPISFASFGNTSNILLHNDSERKLERQRNKELFRDVPPANKTFKRTTCVNKTGKKYLRDVFINGNLQRVVSVAKLKSKLLTEQLPTLQTWHDRFAAVRRVQR